MKRLMFFLSFIIAGISLHAQDQTSKIDTRQAVQSARIREGKRSNELTRKERIRLKAEQRNIRRAERRVKADGVVTPIEQAKLSRKQNRASRDIRRAKHNSKKPQK